MSSGQPRLPYQRHKEKTEDGRDAGGTTNDEGRRPLSNWMSLRLYPELLGAIASEEAISQERRTILITAACCTPTEDSMFIGTRSSSQGCDGLFGGVKLFGTTL